jgi:hypothetical protein
MCLDHYKSNMEKLIDCTDFSFKKEDIFESDFFFSSDKYKDFFINLHTILSFHYNTPIKISVFKIFKGDIDMLVENDNNDLIIDKGLFMKLKVFDKKNLLKTLNGTNNRLVIHNRTIEIHNILIYNNVSRSLDIPFLNLLLKDQKLIDENEIIIEFVNRIVRANNIDVIFIIGTNVALLIKEVLEDYGILIFEYLSSLNHKVSINFS